jgi:acyl-CoA thioesterase
MVELSFDEMLSKAGSFKRLFDQVRGQGLNLEENASNIFRMESPLFSLAKFSIKKLGDGYSELGFPYSETISRHGGMVHGGMASYALDTAGGLAVMTQNEGIDQLTLELKINFLEPMRSSPFTASGTVIRSGRSVSVAEAEIRDEEGKLCAKALGTWYKIYPRNDKV